MSSWPADFPPITADEANLPAGEVELVRGLLTPEPEYWLHGMRPALYVLAAALVLGIASNRLFSGAPLGLNLAIFTGLLAIASILLSRFTKANHSRTGILLLLPAVFFGACASWRDSDFLLGLNVGLSIFFFALAAIYSHGPDFLRSALSSYPAYLLQSGVNALIGAPKFLFSEVQWQEFRSLTFSGKARAIFRGLILALPLVVVFGALFRSADANFERLVSNAFAWLPPLSIPHIVWVIAASWVVLGYLRHYLFVRPVSIKALEPSVGFQIGSIEILIVLSCLNALFLGFVLTQLPYLFGGSRHVLTTADLTLANYARRGFFELVTVAALLLPVLLWLDWMLRGVSGRQLTIVRFLFAGLITLLFVVLYSAVQRMLLYSHSLGLTELRLYVTAFIGFLALVFAWFCATVLRGHREQFAFGALIIGSLSAVVIQAINPDALIARTNLERAAAGKPIDVVYLASLGADAIPAYHANNRFLPKETRAAMDTAIAQKEREYRQQTWRSLNLGRRLAMAHVTPQPK